jgi:hypothetical protein
VKQFSTGVRLVYGDKNREGLLQFYSLTKYSIIRGKQMNKDTTSKLISISVLRRRIVRSFSTEDVQWYIGW